MTDQKVTDPPSHDGDQALLDALQDLIGVGDFVWSDDGKLSFRRVTSAPTPIALDLPGSGIGPFDLEDLFTAIGLDAISAEVLAVIPLHDGVYLTGLEMQAGASLDRANLFLSVDWPTASWSPFASVEFHAPAMTISIFDGEVSGEVSGIVSFADIDLTASLRFPEKQISAHLSAEEGIKLAPLLEHFQMSAHGLDHLEIDQMSVDIDLDAGTRDLKLDLLGVWSAGEFEVANLSLELAHNSNLDDGLYAVLSGHAKVTHDTEDPILIGVSALHTGVDAGWQLEGDGQFPKSGLAVGDALSVMFEKIGIPLADRVIAKTFEGLKDVFAKGSLTIGNAGAVIHHGMSVTQGRIKNFKPNREVGLFIETITRGQSSGMFMNGRTMTIWNSGNDDLLRIHTESDLKNKNGVWYDGRRHRSDTPVPRLKLTSNGDLAIAGSLSVSGHASVSNDLTVAGDLSVSGKVGKSDKDLKSGKLENDKNGRVENGGYQYIGNFLIQWGTAKSSVDHSERFNFHVKFKNPSTPFVLASRRLGEDNIGMTTCAYDHFTIDRQNDINKDSTDVDWIAYGFTS